jgi:hypothetical protein
MAKSNYQKFQKRLTLADYMRHTFGIADPEAPKEVRQYHESLRTVEEGRNASGLSHLAGRLMTMSGVQIDDAALRRYDENVARHTERINARREAPIEWRYFQLLAALMTEHYLSRAMGDAGAFVAEINAFAEARNAHRSYYKYPTLTTDDLDKLAFWMATGSGKTLLMHLNIYQYRHYAAKHERGPLDHVILVTPNEGLTRQHMAEMQRSGIECGYYADLMATPAEMVEDVVKVIEISKLTENKTGEGVSVEATAFEGRNLVLVDEGHKGGDTWRMLRRTLAEDGFTFEYSATFGQAIASAKVDVQEAYGKAILFDYSYRFFYDDGYGKDYRILNLKEDVQDDLTDRYLLANLLTYYEQQRVFAGSREAMMERYNLQPPLLVFVGHSVTGGRTVSRLGAEDKRSITDIQRLVRFLQRVLADDGGWAASAIDAILSGESGIEMEGRDLFAGRFEALRKTGISGGALLSDLRERVFHATGPTALHLVNLKQADGEIGLRAGDSDAYFGVIDVGNDRGFLQLTERDLPEIEVRESDFQDSLFKRINRPDSAVNVLLGSRKFIEGWSSWRVSTMGLMNIGRGEGPQIIQLFGRGVRLLGEDRSLKRSSEYNGSSLRTPPHLRLVETLNVFGVRAKYMTQFRDYLKDEGIETAERVPLRIKTRVQDAFLNKGLHVLRADLEGTTTSLERLALSFDTSAESEQPVVDLTPQVGLMQSEGAGGNEVPTGGTDANPRRQIPTSLVPLLYWPRLYRACWRHREKEGYDGLTFDQATLRRLIAEEHYDLRCPEDLLACNAFGDLRRIESIVLRILRTYISDFQARHRRRKEQAALRYEPLRRDDDNLVGVIEARVKRTATEFLQDLRARLAEVTDIDGGDLLLFEGDEDLYEKDGDRRDGDDTPPRVHFDRHLYLPLVVDGGSGGVVTYAPKGLNEGETRFVRALRDFVVGPQGQAFLGNSRSVYLLRNQSRGRGIGFQMERGGRFYPDFILWVMDGQTQHIAFIDPKGLVFAGDIKAHPKVTFCREIGTFAEAAEAPDGLDVRLHAFIVSVTGFNELDAKQTLDTRADFNTLHVYFEEDSETVW